MFRMAQQVVLRHTVGAIALYGRSVRRYQSTMSTSLSSKLKVDPSRLVDGMTRERIDNDPAVAAYIQANFPEAFEKDSTEDEDPVYEQMRAMGYSTEPPNSYDGKKKKSEKNPVYPRNIRPLVAYLRDPLREEGSHNSLKLRRDNKLIPGMLYGSDPTKGIASKDLSHQISIKSSWNMLRKELMLYHRSFESRVYELTLKAHPEDESGTVYLVKPENVNRHPVDETIYCCNFLRYHPGRPLKIPVEYINTEESPAMKKEGFVVPINRFLEVFVDEGLDIPESIPVDCTGAKFRQSLKIDRAHLPDGVRISDRVKQQGRRFIFGVIFGGSRGANLTEETTTEEKKEKEKPKAKAK